MDLAALTVQVLDSVENNCEFKPLVTMHGRFEIEKVNTPDFVVLKDQLPEHLNSDNKENLADIEAYIDYLNKAIQDYYKHMDDK